MVLPLASFALAARLSFELGAHLSCFEALALFVLPDAAFPVSAATSDEAVALQRRFRLGNSDATSADAASFPGVNNARLANNGAGKELLPGFQDVAPGAHPKLHLGLAGVCKTIFIRLALPVVVVSTLLLLLLAHGARRGSSRGFRETLSGAESTCAGLLIHLCVSDRLHPFRLLISILVAEPPHLKGHRVHDCGRARSATLRVAKWPRPFKTLVTALNGLAIELPRRLALTGVLQNVTRIIGVAVPQFVSILVRSV